MGNFVLQIGPCSSLILRISPWGIPSVFLLSSTLSWRLPSFYFSPPVISFSLFCLPSPPLVRHRGFSLTGLRRTVGPERQAAAARATSRARAAGGRVGERRAGGERLGRVRLGQVQAARARALREASGSGQPQARGWIWPQAVRALGVGAVAARRQTERGSGARRAGGCSSRRATRLSVCGPGAGAGRERARAAAAGSGRGGQHERSPGGSARRGGSARHGGERRCGSAGARLGAAAHGH
jgi:hypothetical protein